jgi:hypothetical protein
MTRIVLEIPKEEDKDLLLDLLHRLGVRIVEESQVMDEDTAAYILSGLPARDDFDDFAQDFEAARKDRDMPDRIN